MESSDDEFVWTNTSKDDSESEVEMPYDGESESGKSYKRKLQKELFQNGELDSSTEAEEPKKRKKKLKRASPPPPPARRASPSPPPARRPRWERPPGGLDDSAAGQHILNMKVKEERASIKREKKKKKKRGRGEEYESSTTEAPDADGAASPRSDEGRTRSDEGRTRGPERASAGERDLLIDKFEAEETVVERRVQVNGHARTNEPDQRGSAEGCLSREFVEDDSSDDSRVRPSDADAESPRTVRVDDGEGAPNISKRITFEEPQAEPEVSKPVRRISERITFEESQDEPEAPEQARRISDRITFEESQSESEPSLGRPSPPAPPPPPPPPRARLGRHLRAHAHMRPVVGALPPGAAVSAHDDVWLVRAPRDLDARALLGAALPADARARLKVGGRALDAAPAGGAGRAALALPGPGPAGGGRVLAVAVRGALRLRWRPPRARAPPAAADEPPARVPAPDTRPRHPLLGAAHERAAALAPHVRRRLAAAAAAGRGRGAVDEPDRVDDDATERREKKKKKKKHRERPDPDPTVAIRPEPEETKPNKRKRKHSSRAEPDPHESESRREPDSPPRKKKVKKEKKDKKETRRDDASVWDSERAIEESLFNF